MTELYHIQSHASSRLLQRGICGGLASMVEYWTAVGAVGGCLAKVLSRCFAVSSVRAAMESMNLLSERRAQKIRQ